MSTLENTTSGSGEKLRKNLKKGVDKGKDEWYYSQARLRAPNLENDTETKKRKTTVNKLEFMLLEQRSLTD